jgi:hypothetical protein
MRTFGTDPDRRSAVLTGSLLIVGSLLGIVGLGVFLEPLLGASDHLRAFGTMETRVLIASLLELMMGVSLVGMAVAVYPVVKRFSPGAAVAYLAARVLEMVTYVVGVVSMLALVELGKQYVAAGAAGAARFEPLGSILLGVPDWAGNIVLDVAIFPLGAAVLYWVFFRTGLVPKWLSGWGLVGAALYCVAGILVMFHVIVPLETPHIALQSILGVQEIVLAIWLIARGFNPRAAMQEALHA